MRPTRDAARPSRACNGARPACARSSTSAPDARSTEWMARLPQIGDRLSALGVLLHEIEEPLLRGRLDRTSHAREAGYWLDRAAGDGRRIDRVASTAARLDARDRRQPRRRRRARAGAQPRGAGRRGATASSSTQPTGDLRPAVEHAKRHGDELIERAERLGIFADDLVEETEFDFLFDAERQLFSIGFNVVGRTARRLVLRHAGVRGAARELPGDRHRQDLARALVQARTIADAERAARARCCRGARRCSST